MGRLRGAEIGIKGALQNIAPFFPYSILCFLFLPQKCNTDFELIGSVDTQLSIMFLRCVAMVLSEQDAVFLIEGELIKLAEGIQPII